MLPASPALKRLLSDFEFESVLECTFGVNPAYEEEFKRAGKRWSALDLRWQRTSREAAFDCIWVSECLERVRDPVRALRMLRRALRPGGVIVVTVPYLRTEVRSGEVNIYTAGHLLQQLVLAGFDCSQAMARTYSPWASAIAVLDRSKSDAIRAAVKRGAWNDLAAFFPKDYRIEGFNGRIDSVNWKCLTLYGKHPVDFTDVAEQREVVLCGGHPSIAAQADVLRSLTITKAVMNNTAKLVAPDIWFGMDKPERYDLSILQDKRPIKIGRMNYPGELVAGRPWRELENTWFISDVKNRAEGDWLNDGALVWFKDTFKVAIQILYRMGYRKIFLAGCGFNQPGDYAYGSDPNVVERNTRLYGESVQWLKANTDYFRRNGLEIVNCTPGSAADFLPDADLSSLTSA